MTSRRQQGGGAGGGGSGQEGCPRTLTVAVVGLSGTEREKGPTGVGKSCLCNRFVRPLADDYHTDHISVLSQTDFGGRVVNNDHFLYWGEVVKSLEEGPEFNFHVVEQTEFIDDSSFQPFKSGKTDPYIKRCTAIRLTSAEKFMYICKNQLGIEKEYEQKLLPDGRLSVDGFVCVFDVSPVPGRSLEKQVEFTGALLGALVRTRKPLVLATTKGDEACEAHLREAERLVNRKDLRGQVPLVETSAHENINVDQAFLVLAQLVDRANRNARWGRIPSFSEAARARRDTLDQATDAFQAVQKAKDRVDQYHLYQYRLIPHCPSVEEPPPPYTPGYYDPTTGQPYHVPGGDEAAFGSVRQRVVLPSCPAPAFGGGRGLARPPPVPQQLPSRPPGGNNNPDWLLPRDPPAACPPSPWPPAWGSDGEEEDRLSAAMGAARLG
ncbi:hypothetical protein ISCGN_030377 [Ixodes scapularis]